eukprot:gene3250-13273_t
MAAVSSTYHEEIPESVSSRHIMEKHALSHVTGGGDLINYDPTASKSSARIARAATARSATAGAPGVGGDKPSPSRNGVGSAGGVGGDRPAPSRSGIGGAAGVGGDKPSPSRNGIGGAAGVGGDRPAPSRSGIGGAGASSSRGSKQSAPFEGRIALRTALPDGAESPAGDSLARSLQGMRSSMSLSRGRRNAAEGNASMTDRAPPPIFVNEEDFALFVLRFGITSIARDSLLVYKMILEASGALNELQGVLKDGETLAVKAGAKLATRECSCTEGNGTNWAVEEKEARQMVATLVEMRMVMPMDLSCAS